MNPPFPARLLAAALAAAIPLQSARAELVELAWSPARTFERTLRIAPKKFAELCGKLVRGESVSWSFEASGATNFNVHYHEGKQVTYPVKQDAVSSARGNLSVALDQDYCWMWTNPGGSEVVLKATLSKEGR